MIQYINKVTYWAFFEKKTRMRGACFGGMFRSYDKDKGWLFNPPPYMIYRAHINPITNREAVDFFLDFLTKLLDNSLFKFKIGGRKGFPTLLLALQVGKMNWARSLLYLTAFRYVSEYPEIINELYKRKTDKSTLEELFSIFQQIHLDCYKGTVQCVAGNLGGHGLMYHYGMSEKPISIADFQKNLSNNSVGNVHNHFKPAV